MSVKVLNEMRGSMNIIHFLLATLIILSDGEPDNGEPDVFEGVDDAIGGVTNPCPNTESFDCLITPARHPPPGIKAFTVLVLKQSCRVEWRGRGSLEDSGYAFDGGSEVHSSQS